MKTYVISDTLFFVKTVIIFPKAIAKEVII